MTYKIKKQDKEKTLKQAEKIFKLARHLDIKRKLQELAFKYLDMIPKHRYNHIKKERVNY